MVSDLLPLISVHTADTTVYYGITDSLHVNSWWYKDTQQTWHKSPKSKHVVP